MPAVPAAMVFLLLVAALNARGISESVKSNVVMTVVETEPEIKGATVSNVGKPAKLETGIIIQVPAFIKTGEKIRVDTAEGRYIERAK